MRWGRWLLASDGESLVLYDDAQVEPVITVPTWKVYNLALLVRELWPLRDKITGADVMALLIAANELVWRAWDFDGIGDWTDEAGRQRGAAA